MEMNSVMATEIVAAEVEHIVLPQIVSIKQASRMLGLPPYYLRRLCKEVPGVAFVSLLMSNPDIGVATVAAEAGHAQPSTTLMIYTQQYKKRRESIRNQLSRELYEK